MTLTLGASGFFPVVCGVYTCPCGRRAVRHGRFAARLPSGWHLHAETHVCPECSRRPRPPERSREQQDD